MKRGLQEEPPSSVLALPVGVGSAQERDLEQGLIDHVQRFLMELGVGSWAAFYLSAVDAQMRHADDRGARGGARTEAPQAAVSQG